MAAKDFFSILEFLSLYIFSIEFHLSHPIPLYWFRVADFIPYYEVFLRH